MRASTMSKKPRQRPQLKLEQDEAPEVSPVVADSTDEIEVKPRRFVPRPCSLCEAHRKGQNYSHVYHTSGRVRYCKCKLCNHTWTQAAELP